MKIDGKYYSGGLITMYHGFIPSDNMREINKCIIHCADTRTDQDFDISDIRQWHFNRGWSDVGYHIYIKLDGTIQSGRPIDRAGAHCKGHNTDSIGVCFEGGKNPDGSKWGGFTAMQIVSFMHYKKKMFADFGEIPIYPHSDFSSKTCPNCSIDCLL